MMPVDYKSITAEQIVNFAHETEVSFVCGQWLGKRTADRQRCACAVGQLALMQGYEPEFLLIENDPTYANELILWEDEDDLFKYLRKLGFTEAYLFGLSDGYEESTLNKYDYSRTNAEGDYALGHTIGEQVAQLAANKQHFTNFQFAEADAT